MGKVWDDQKSFKSWLSGQTEKSEENILGEQGNREPKDHCGDGERAPEIQSSSTFPPFHHLDMSVAR